MTFICLYQFIFMFISAQKRSQFTMLFVVRYFQSVVVLSDKTPHELVRKDVFSTSVVS